MLILVRGDDWQALYADGKKVLSGHKIQVEQISEWTLKLGTKVKTHWISQEYQNALEESGDDDFADDLKDVGLEP